MAGSQGGRDGELATVSIPKAVGERLKIKMHCSGQRGAFSCVVTVVPRTVPAHIILHAYDRIIEVAGSAVSGMASGAELTDHIKRSGGPDGLLALAIHPASRARLGLRAAAEAGDAAAQFVLGKTWRQRPQTSKSMQTRGWTRPTWRTRCQGWASTPRPRRCCAA